MKDIHYKWLFKLDKFNAITPAFKNELLEDLQDQQSLINNLQTRITILETHANHTVNNRSDSNQKG